jgi:hypothetical protein
MIHLDKNDFVKFAIKHYRNPQCLTADEFFEDLNRFKYIKRLLNRYERTGIIQEKLVVNHIISIYNVFDLEAANEMIFAKTKKTTWPALKTFLVFLNFVNADESPEIKIDKHIHNKLNKL